MRVLFCSYFALFLLLFVKNEEERFFLPKRNEAKGKLRKEMNEANSANGFHSRAYHRKSIFSRLFLIYYDFKFIPDDNMSLTSIILFSTRVL